MGRLDFGKYKEEFKVFVKNTTDFSDVNYEGSGINQIINVLSYQMTQIGAYLYMNDNEHYLQTAQLNSSVRAHAKQYGYIVKGKRCSRAEVNLETIVDEMPLGNYVHVARDLSISGKNIYTDVVRNFLLENDVYIYDYEKIKDGKFRFFTTKPVVILQGERNIWRFPVTNDENQRFLIKEPMIDIDTLKIVVKNSLSDVEVGEEYLISNDIVNEYGKERRLFTVATAENGWYEIFFGGNVIGKQPKVGQYIICEYMISDGEVGNGCTKFTLGKYTVTPIGSSFGGSDGESIESVKQNAPYSFRRQNRLISDTDIKTIILQEFRNISTINVWRGEDNVPKAYGKTFIAIKPNNSESLSHGAKIDIKERLLNNYGYCGMDIMLVDPQYINVDLDVKVKLKPNIGSITKKSVDNAVKEQIENYNENNLNQFDKYLNDNELNKIILDNVSAVDSVYSTKYLNKDMVVNTNNSSTYICNLANSIVAKTVDFEINDYNYQWKVSDDGEGNLYAKQGNITKNIGTVDYSKGIVSFRLPLVSNKYYSFVVSVRAKSDTPNVYSMFINIARIRNIQINYV